MHALRKLFLGLFLIALAAAILVASDLRSRTDFRESAGANADNFKVAVIQNASQTVLEDGVRGMLDGLEAKGYRQTDNLEVRIYNAEGDMATLNTIARDAANGDYDVLLSVSTPGLQAVANANRQIQKDHVFALVTDPWSAGVGITGNSPADHPPYLAGYGTMQPVKQAFSLAKAMFPGLKKVGVVYNASEQNSVAQLEIAREVVNELGIELSENTADNSSNVGEATKALISRGAEAIWILGDSTVLTASQAVIQDAEDAGIPVFTVIPPTAESGALFDVGANYYQTGKKAGELAAEVLGGLDPASVRIENYAPELLIINLDALKGLRQPWKVPPDLLQRADEVIDSTGAKTKSRPTPAPQAARHRAGDLPVGLAMPATLKEQAGTILH